MMQNHYRLGTGGGFVVVSVRYRSIWWAWRESNPHSLRNTILSRTRLPIPPHAQGLGAAATSATVSKSVAEM